MYSQRLAFSLPAVPYELQMEILARIPVSCLCRFKCVCRRWREIISSKYFGRLQLRLSRPTHYMLLHHRNTNKYRTFAYGTLQAVALINEKGFTQSDTFGNQIIFVGSILGIICLYVQSVKSAILWNPATHHFKILPERGYDHPGARYILCSIGFGVDPSTKDFKVFYIRSMHGIISVAHVWSHNINDWESTEVHLPGRFTPRSEVCDMIGEEYVYWIGTIRTGDVVVGSIKLTSNVFETRALPEQHFSKPEYMLAGVNWNGRFRLGVCLSEVNRDEKGFWLYDMTDVGWSRNGRLWVPHRACPIVQSINQHALFFTLGRRAMLLLANFADQEGVLWFINERNGYNNQFVASDYTESVVMLDGFNPVNAN